MIYKQIVAITVSIFLFLTQTLSAANLEIDMSASSANKPYLESAPNGVTVVNIVAPTAQGLSHNKFKNYNVDSKGLILNNSGAISNTQLAGYISFNKNLTGNSAKLILNEVTGTNRSILKGYTEVAGAKADVIVANPNGITVNGGGFINTNKATLTTGNPFFNASGLQGFDVSNGDILIEGDGFNANNIDKVNLYTKALQLNAKLYAKSLNVVTGKNNIALDGTVTKQDNLGSGISIDSSLLGGIYANTISLVSNDKGVGINLPPEVYAQDSLAISADGDIVLEKTLAQNSININTQSTLHNTKEMMANDIDLEAKNIINTDKIEAKNNIQVTAESVENSGYFNSASDMTFDVDSLDNYATLFSGNDINLYVKDTLYNHKNANILALNNITIGKADQKTNLVKNETANIETINGDINIFANTLENTTDSLDKKETVVSTESLYTKTSAKYIPWAINELKKEGKTKTVTNMKYERNKMIIISNGKFGSKIEYVDVYFNADAENDNSQMVNPFLVTDVTKYQSGTIGLQKEPDYRYTIKYISLLDIRNKIDEYSTKFGIHVDFISGGMFDPKVEFTKPLKREKYRKATITVKDESINSTPTPATILSGAKMNLNVGSTRNYLSQIAANDTLNITGDSLDNSGENLFRINSFTGKYKYCYKECNSHFHDPNYKWAPLPSKTTYEIIDQVYSSIYSAKDITGDVVTVNNIDIKADQAPLGSSGSTLLLDETLDTLNIDPTTKKVEIKLPEGEYGQFLLSNDKESNYLVERNPAFTSFESFISSDYMLSRLDFNLDDTIKRVDGLYESKLIRDSVFAQSGKRYLNSDITNDQDQFTYLMDNALELQDDLQLTPAIALTKEQKEVLTKDIVWMEEKILNGQRVLVPVVYLANATNLDSSLILANNNINLNVNNLVNTGAIQAGENLNVNADNDILNAGGKLQAGNELNLQANNNIVNLSGTLQANKIDIESDVFISDVATNQIKKEYEDGYENNTLVSESSKINSNTDININAASGINIIGTQVKANEDVTLSSEGDVNIASKEVTNTYDNNTDTGHLRISKTQQLSSSIESNNLQVDANNITVQASTVTAKENINLNANENVNIIEANNNEASDYKHNVSGTRIRDKKDITTIVSSILTANNVNINSKNTNLIASQIIANEAQITADILNLISKKNIDYADYYEDNKKLMTRSITSIGHINEEVVEASIQTQKFIFNEKDLTDKLQTENLVKKISSQYDLTEEQINLVREIANSEEWDDKTKSLTGVGQLVIAVVVTVCTMGAGTAIVGAAGTATAGTTAATVQAAVVQSVVTGATNQLVTAAITGNSFKLDTKSLLLGAISAGVMSYASGLIDTSLGLENIKPENMTVAQQFERGVANTVVRSGVNSALYGTDFQASLKMGLATDISNVGFRYAGDTAVFGGLEDGSLGKAALHSVVGAGAAALMGEDIAVGAAAAGANELLGFISADLDEKRQLEVSGLIGGLAGYAVKGDSGIEAGQTIARSATEYNRQLHQDEVKFIKENKDRFAKELYGDSPTDEQKKDAESRLAQQGLRGTDKAWSLVLGTETDTQAQQFLKENSNGLFTVKDEYEFKDGSTNGEVELSDLEQKDFNEMNDFYRDNLYNKTSTNSEGARFLGEEYQADKEKTLNSIKDMTSDEYYYALNRGLINFVPNLVNGFLELPQTFNSAGNYVDALAPTTTKERLDILYNQGDVGSKTQANLATMDVIGTASMVTGAGVIVKHVASGVTEGVVKSVDDGLDINTNFVSASGSPVELVNVGSKGNWDKMINREFKPNTAYQLDNGHTYITDAKGNVDFVEADLSKITMPRNNYQQSTTGKSGNTGDQGGHLIAASLGGAGDKINLVPMDKILNNGTWKKMESDLAKALDAGKNVSVKIDVGYPDGGGVRPNSFIVTTKINGIEETIPFRQ